MTTLTRIEEVIARTGEVRAGGTDLQERLRSGVTRAPVVDLQGLPGLSDVTWSADGGATVGALVTVADVGRDARLAAKYPGLVLPARTLATPQIRAMATMGGVLLQRTRCAYFRHPELRCLKSGGSACLARAGDHHLGVCFDKGPCAYPHPSSIGMTLLAYEAEVEVHGRGRISVEALYGDGADPTRDHLLDAGEVLTRIHLPKPVEGERASYFRLMSRTWAEWPLVEVSVRLVAEGDSIGFARVAIGAVANVPLRLPRVEAALVGSPLTQATFERAADVATEGANPLPQTAYKVGLVRASVLEALEQAARP
jgi:xanthine dehydrogenase YagS FAD-binding subunit